MFRIQQKFDAVNEILLRCRDSWELVISEITIEEISQIPNPIRRARVQPFLLLAQQIITFDSDIINRMKELKILDLKTADAFHVACTERAQAVYLTTDNAIIRSFIIVHCQTSWNNRSQTKVIPRCAL